MVVRIIGFTGTREGMTVGQEHGVEIVLKSYDVVRVDHGDCIGSDEKFHEIVRRYDPLIKIYIHPPIDDSRRAYCDGDQELPPKPFLVRDDDIIDASDMMLATPKGYREIMRSGTWATIRHTIKKGKPLIIIFPDGTAKMVDRQNRPRIPIETL